MHSRYDDTLFLPLETSRDQLTGLDQPIGLSGTHITDEMDLDLQNVLKTAGVLWSLSWWRGYATTIRCTNYGREIHKFNFLFYNLTNSISTLQYHLFACPLLARSRLLLSQFCCLPCLLSAIGVVHNPVQNNKRTNAHRLTMVLFSPSFHLFSLCQKQTIIYLDFISFEPLNRSKLLGSEGYQIDDLQWIQWLLIELLTRC